MALLKGKFLVSCSNGSKANNQTPSLRVRLAESKMTVALVRCNRSNLLGWCRNNPQSAERRELQQQLVEQGFTYKDLEEILSK